MISFLSAIVVMVAIGTLVQRADGLSGLFEADAPEAALFSDRVAVKPGALTRIDVLGNDIGLDRDDVSNLRISAQPACGQVFVQGDVLQFLADESCAGQQRLTYTLTVDGNDLTAEVIARVLGDAPEPKPQPKEDVASANALPPELLNSPGGPVFAVDDPAPEPARKAPAKANPSASSGTRGIQDNTARDVLATGGADSAVAAQPDPLILSALPKDDQSSLGAQGSAGLPEMPSTTDIRPVVDDTDSAPAVEEGIDLIIPSVAVAPRVPSAPSASDQATIIAALPEAEQLRLSTLPPAQGLAEPAGAGAAPSVPEPQPEPTEEELEAERLAIKAETEPELELTPVPRFDPTPPGTRLVSSALARMNLSLDRSPRIAPVPSIAGLGGEAQSSDFLVAVIPLAEPRTAAPPPPDVNNLLDSLDPGFSSPRRPREAAQNGQRENTALEQPETAIAALGPALNKDLVDPKELPLVMEAPVPTRTTPIPQARNTAALPPIVGEQDVGRAQSPTAPNQGESPNTTLAALRQPATPCVTPPATTIDVGRAAQSTISIIAPCHANTIAELTYSGLRFAVPLNAAGKGAVVALGFEPNSPALLIFDNGEKIDFDLPFKGINKVARVALVWDTPVSLELNALEFGAEPGTQDHVRPENKRSFKAIRRSGGGFLHTYRSHSGIGQNAQIYTHFTRQGGKTGIVTMLIDFASRNRDLLDGTCGDGRYAAPQFLVMRSLSGRVERPVLKKLAALDCSDVSREKGDKRLIYGAIGDLVISR